MTDSVAVFPPGFRVTDDNGDAIDGAVIEFFNAGTSTPKTVHSDDDLTVALGTSVTCDAGYPAHSGSKVQVYVGTPDYKVIIKDGTGATLATHDNVKGALTTPTTVTEAFRKTPVVSKTSNYTVLEADWGKLINANPTGGTFTLTLPSAVSVGDGFTIGMRHVGTANTVTLATILSQTISGPGKSSTSKALTSYGEGFWFVSDGANWHVDSYTPPSMTGRLPFILITDRLTAPPTSPVGGARYIINGTATGVWSSLSFALHDVAEADGNGGWTKYTPAEGWLAYVEDENLYTAFIGTAWADQTGMATPSTSTLKRMVVQNLQTSGADGGSMSHGTVTTATLNSTLFNSITGASLASNQITLPAGTYAITASKNFSGANANQVNTSKIRLFNVTAGALILNAISPSVTSTSNGSGVASGGSIATLFCTVTFAVTTTIRLDMVGSTSDSTAIGLGEAAGGSINEVYATVDILDLASLQGPIGPTGAQGADGLDAAYPYQWSTSTSGDPGSGKIAGNSATIASITQIAVSETDVYGASMQLVLPVWDDSTSSVKALLKISKEGATQNFHQFKISGAGTDQGAYWTFPVTYVSTGGTIANADNVAVLVVEKGDKGDTGSTGSTGATGATGATGPNTGLDYAFNTATSGDPGSGKILYNSATPGSVTSINVSKTGRNAESWGTLIGTFDDSTNTAHRGKLRVFTLADRTKFLDISFTSTFTDNSTYWTIPVSAVDGSGTLHANNDIVAVMFERTGNKGADGAGSGDVSGPASAVDNELVLFNGTGGKTIKRASTTGIVKATSGVISAAVSGTDYAPATSGTAILKGNGSGGFSSAASGTDYAPATSGTALLKGNGSGGFSSAASGTDYAPATSGSAIQKGNGSGGFSAAVAGTDYYNPGGTDVAIADGGTGASSATAAFNALSPMTTQGDIAYHNGTNVVRLGTGSSGQFLKSQGPAANLIWDNPAGSGDVTAAAAFATDNVLVRSDGTGKGVQSTAIAVDDSNNVSGMASLAMPTIPTAGYNAPVNISLAVSAAASALTIAIKGADGNDCSATNPAYIPFRSATATTGALTWRGLTAASSLVISSGSTLGVTSATAFRLWVVMFDDAGTLRPGVILASTHASNQATIAALSPRGLASSTAEGGAGAADSAQTFYTGTAVTSKSYAILGYLEWSASGLTAGTWTTTNLIANQVWGPGVPLPGQMVQMGSAYSAAGSSVSSTTFTTVTGSTITVVPTSAANFIKLFYSGQTRAAAGGAGVNTEVICTIARAGTAIGPNNNTGVVSGAGTNQQTDGACALNFIDWPNTASSTAYTFQQKGLNTSGACTTSTLYGTAEEIMT